MNFNNFIKRALGHKTSIFGQQRKLAQLVVKDNFSDQNPDSRASFRSAESVAS